MQKVGPVEKSPAKTGKNNRLGDSPCSGHEDLPLQVDPPRRHHRGQLRLHDQNIRSQAVTI